jgi:hypothetical protein
MNTSSSVVIGGLGAPKGVPFKDAGKSLKNEYGKQWATNVLDSVSER